jgi:DtxR family transcriptional regulator, Mn-dependent transcriptional regulator
VRNHELGDEILQALWMKKNEQGKVLNQQNSEPLEKIDASYKKLITEDKIRQSNGEYSLTALGEAIGRQLVRRHRLAERLFHDLLGFSDEQSHIIGCGFEHFLEDDATDAVCTFLGHPPTCPHNSPIPEGPCCRNRKKQISPLILPLHDLDVGKKGKVTFVRSDDHKITDRLIALGIYPGQVVHLHQKIPTFLIQVDETEIGVEAGVAATIFVRPVE